MERKVGRMAGWGGEGGRCWVEEVWRGVLLVGMVGEWAVEAMDMVV